MKTIAISGASGFVGQSLVDFFSKQNYKVVQIKRDILNNSLKLDELINSLGVTCSFNSASKRILKLTADMIPSLKNH